MCCLLWGEPGRPDWVLAAEPKFQNGPGASTSELDAGKIVLRFGRRTSLLLAVG